MLPASESRRVLYLEDSKADAELARSVLARFGYHVDVVAVPGDCLKFLWRHDYAAFLVDHILERYRGIELLGTLRKIGIELPPTYLVSSCEEAALGVLAGENGALGFIAKGSRYFADDLVRAVLDRP